ncbi:MAG: AAA family ATPase [Acidobacteria bacterium]|nr:MAG: AAA family ATPase [Acidobacteriota bacterium]
MRAEADGKATAPEPACERCGGIGFIVEPDGGNGIARPCDCRKERRGDDLLKRARIPAKHRDCRLENFYTRSRTASPGDRRSLLEAHRASELYVDHFLDPERGAFRSSGLIYVGPPGTGKTHLATAVLIALIERYGVRGRFVNTSHLVFQIQSTFDPGSPETKRQILDPITRAEVLVLDELGATKPSDWVQDLLYLLINERYINNRPTIFTTNYRLESLAPPPDDGARERRPADEVTDGAVAQVLGGARPRAAPPALRRDGRYELLEQRVSPQVVSRIYEMAQPIQLGNRDYRRAVMMQQRIRGR